jgi:hypothetical protein
VRTPSRHGKYMGAAPWPGECQFGGTSAGRVCTDSPHSHHPATRSSNVVTASGQPVAARLLHSWLSPSVSCMCMRAVRLVLISRHGLETLLQEPIMPRKTRAADLRLPLVIQPAHTRKQQPAALLTPLRVHQVPYFLTARSGGTRLEHSCCILHNQGPQAILLCVPMRSGIWIIVEWILHFMGATTPRLKVPTCNTLPTSISGR